MYCTKSCLQRTFIKVY